MLSEFEVFPLGISFKLLQRQTCMQLDKGRDRRCRTHHFVSLILKISDHSTDGHRPCSPFSFHCRYQTSTCFDGEVEHTVHTTVFRLTETVQCSLSWSLSLISARMRKKSFSKNPSEGSLILAAGRIENPKLSSHTAGKNSSKSPSNRTAFEKTDTSPVDLSPPNLLLLCSLFTMVKQ